MPQLRLVVLAMQDRLAYAPTFEAALAGLFGASAVTAAPSGTAATVLQPSSSPLPTAPVPLGPQAPQAPQDVNALIAQAAQDLADYQRLTADGKLAEAGQKLEHLKQALEQLKKR
jgi:uncharacterized membrane protein (UPF0182 family)